MKHTPIIEDIIAKYEVPKEYMNALWKAYEEGIKKGFIDGSIAIMDATAPSSGVKKNGKDS